MIRSRRTLFRPGSSILLQKAKADIDAGARWVKPKNTKGWVVAVAGVATVSEKVVKVKITMGGGMYGPVKSQVKVGEGIPVRVSTLITL
jgi:hypothetical protein